jgi:hypothetical protein
MIKRRDLAGDQADDRASLQEMGRAQSPLVVGRIAHLTGTTSVKRQSESSPVGNRSSLTSQIDFPRPREPEHHRSALTSAASCWPSWPRSTTPSAITPSQAEARHRRHSYFQKPRRRWSGRPRRRHPVIAQPRREGEPVDPLPLCEPRLRQTARLVRREQLFALSSRS